MVPAQAVEPPLAAAPADATTEAGPLAGLGWAYLVLAVACLVLGVVLVSEGLAYQPPAAEAAMDDATQRANWLEGKRHQLSLRLGTIAIIGSLLPTAAAACALRDRWLGVPVAVSIALALLLPLGLWAGAEQLLPHPEQPTKGGTAELVVSSALIALGGFGAYSSLTLISHLRHR